MKRTAIIFLSFLLVANCYKPHGKTLVKNYSDFGPQAMAWEYIGKEWWQWNPTGGSDPKTKYDIKIVIFRDIQLVEVKKKFPVIKEKKQDYRYLKYKTAIEYLDKNIEEGILPEVTELLMRTQKDLIANFGN